MTDRSAVDRLLRSPWTAVAIAAAAFAACSPWWQEGLKGGIAVVGAERVLHGEVPYRDFWTMYAPGQFYLLAALFGIFGTSLRVAAAGASLLLAAGAVPLHRLLVRTGAGGAVATTAALVYGAAVAVSPFQRELGSYPPAILGVLLALLAVRRRLEQADEGSLRPVAQAGLWLGFTALFKHDVAAYTALTLAAGLVAHGLLLARQDRWLLAERLRDVVRLAAAALVPVLPVALALALVAGPDAWRDLIVFPGTIFRHTRPESFPSLLPTGLWDPWKLKLLFNVNAYLTFVLPFLLGVLALPAIALHAVGRRAGEAAWTVALAAGLFLHWSAAHVQINTHAISMTVYALLILAPLIRLRPGRWLPAAVALLLVGWAGAFSLEPAWDLMRARAVERVPLGIPGTVPVVVEPKTAETMRELVAFIEQRVPPGRPVFVGTERHDSVIVNQPMIYFLLDRPPAVRYHEMHPGIIDREPVQREIVDDLERKHVDWVVTMHMFDDDVLDRFSSRLRQHIPDSGSTVLDDYLASRFEPVEELGRFKILRRRQPPDR